MKFWMVCVGLLLTPALQAQTPPFYDNPYSPYHSGTYYPVVYAPQVYSSQFVATCDQCSRSETNDSVNTLTRQVAQLSEEVRQLQSQILLSQAELSRARTVERTTAKYERPAETITVILKNGKRIPAQGYAIARETLWIVTSAGSLKVALSDLDIAATLAANVR